MKEWGFCQSSRNILSDEYFKSYLNRWKMSLINESTGESSCLGHNSVCVCVCARVCKCVCVCVVLLCVSVLSSMFFVFFFLHLPYNFTLFYTRLTACSNRTVYLSIWPTILNEHCLTVIDRDNYLPFVITSKCWKMTNFIVNNNHSKRNLSLILLKIFNLVICQWKDV